MSIKKPARIHRAYTTVPPDAVFITTKQLRNRYGGVSHMWIERRLGDPAFPQPVKVGRLRFFVRDEIESYERNLALGRRQKATASAA